MIQESFSTLQKECSQHVVEQQRLVRQLREDNASLLGKLAFSFFKLKRTVVKDCYYYTAKVMWVLSRNSSRRARSTMGLAIRTCFA